MNTRFGILLLAFTMFSNSTARAGWDLSKMVTEEGGRSIYHARPVDKELLNLWPADLEAEFQRRAHDIITAQTRDVKAGVNTYFENEGK